MSTTQPSPALIAKLSEDSPVLALTGAGVSAESGLSTFRGPGGLWEGREPTELATPEATPLSPVADERLVGPAGEILPDLVEAAGIPVAE